MGWRCAIQIKGLTIGEPKPGQKHRMPLSKAAKEAGYERASRSVTLDKSRSYMNIYNGFMSGEECAKMMEEEASFVKIRMKDGTVRNRKNRADAVVGFAVIFNPPAEVCKDWSDAQYDKFYGDCWDCLCELYPEIFRDENVTMSAEHFDEGLPVTEEDEAISRHMHRIGFARDMEGHWCGNKIDAKMLHDLNVVFPSMMRQRGWTEMEDLDVTDFDRMRTDEEYRKERQAKRKQAGKGVNQYSEGKRRKKLQEASELLEEVEQMHGEATSEREEAKQLRREAFIEKKQAIKSGVALAEEKKKTIIDDAVKQRELIINDAEAKRKSVIETALSDADTMKKNISRMYDENDGNMSGKVMVFLKTLQLVVKKDSLKKHIDAVMDTIALNKDTLNQLYESAKQKKRDKSINHLDDIIAAFSSEDDYGDWEKEQ